MDTTVSITKRTRKRPTAGGARVEHVRFVDNWICPKTGARKQKFFERKADAEAFRAKLLVEFASGTYVDAKTAPTVAKAIDHWLADRTGKVKASTLGSYKVIVGHVRGPYLAGTPQQRAEYTATGIAPKDTKLVRMLGDVKLHELSTAQIRSWHRELTELSGAYTANRAKSILKTILALAEEDFGVRAPSMPTGLGRGRHKLKKAILTPDQIAKVITAARLDSERGIFVAFPFLVGTRPSEQLGLLWQDIDFEANVIRVRRILERDGSLTEMTKTIAGTRDVPMSKVLREMLLEWRARCPRKERELHLVFPGPGRLQQWPGPRVGGGGPLLYQNFRKRYWVPFFEQIGLPYVTPHSARHSFISTMQAQGIEVGLVARLAGHANATVTLGHYTQAVRGGEVAVEALERAYRPAAS